MSKFQTISELLDETSLKVTSNKNEWKKFINTSAWMFKYSFEDQVLIYAQKPEARACAEFDTWNNKLHRWIKSGAKGIALIKDTLQGSSLRYVFDISDTRNVNNRELKIWSTKDLNQDEMIESLSDVFGSFETEKLDEVIQQIAIQLVEDNAIDYTNTLVNYHENSMLAELNDQEIAMQFKQLLSRSVQYTMMTRCELDVDIYFDQDDFYNITLFNTHETIGLLGSATRDISEMGLSEIGKIARAQELEKNIIHTIAKKAEKVQNTSKDERSIEHEQGDYVQSSGRLSDAQLENGRNSATRQIRNVEKELPKESSTRDILQIKSNEHIERTLADDRESSSSEIGNNGGNDVTERASTEQGNTSTRMGATHEQLEESSGGYYTKGNSLQLDLGGAEVDKEPEVPPFDLHDLPQLLREDVALQHSKEDIIKFFYEHSDENERADYLETCYDDTLVEIFRNPEIYDYTHIGYKKNDDKFNGEVGLPIIGNGLKVWLGGFMKPQKESFLSFSYLQSVVAELIEKDEYLYNPLSKLTHIQWASKNEVINHYVEKVVLTRTNELTVPITEVIGYFSKEHSDIENIDYLDTIYPNERVIFEYEGVKLGYQKSDNGFTYLLENDKHEIKETTYPWGVIANGIEQLILIREYAPLIQIPSEEEQRNAVYTNMQELENGHFFSQKEVDSILINGSGVQHGKYRIYQQIEKHKSVAENTNFIKK